MTDELRWNEPIWDHTEAKRQHYVPRTYLSPFADKDGRIRVVDFGQAEEYKTSLSNVAVEHRYYDIDDEGIDASAEVWLGEIEAKAAPVLKRLIAYPSCIEVLSVEEEFAISRFIAALRFRTPAFRAWNSSTMNSIASQIRGMIMGQIIHQHGEDEGKLIFNELIDRPEYSWLGDGQTPQPTYTSLSMLEETQGFANLIRCAPWRIGYALGPRRLYTSDNPVSGYLRPVRPWWEVGAFASFQYYLPLSPDLLLKIDRASDDESENQLIPRGPRRNRDFSGWEVSMARHVVSYDATRYLYGEGIVVPKQCAEVCLSRIEQSMRELSEAYLGFNPNPYGQMMP